MLHNFLQIMQDQHYVPSGLVDAVDQEGYIREGFWTSSKHSTLGQEGYSSRSGTQEGIRIRQHLVDYLLKKAVYHGSFHMYMQDGSISWQLSHVHARKCI